jgi:hypothetical protein
MFKSAKAVGLVIVIVALIAGGIAVGYWIWGQGPVDKSTVTVNVNEIKNIARIATTEYHISTIVKYEKAKTWIEWEHAMLLVLVNGIITGSVDLEAADIKIINNPNDKRVTILFKKDAVKISNPAIGPDGIVYTTVKNPNIFSRLNDADRKKAMNNAIAELRKGAIEGGIERNTAIRAKEVLGNFLTSLGYKSEIKFDGMDL